jgi:hypothetical protein
MSTLQIFAPARSARVPSYPTVIRNQFRLIDTSRRFLLLLAVLAGASALFLQRGFNNLDLDLIAFPPLLFGAVVWPLFIWHGETRTRRVYHRWLPVGHIAHDFAKVIAGAIWLVIAGVLVAGALKVVAMVALPGAAPTYAAVIAMIAGSLIAYLLASVLPIISDKPWHWFIGSWPVLWLVGNVLENFVPFAATTLGVLFNADFGFYNAIMGADLLQHAFKVRAFPLALLYWSVSVTLWSVIALGVLYFASSWSSRKAEA